MRRSAYWRRAEGGGLRLLSPAGDELGTLRRRGYQRYEVEVGLDSDLIGRVAGVKLSSFRISKIVRDLWEGKMFIIRQARRYEYRGLPCNIAPRANLWAVAGWDLLTGAAGVLEWCRNEADARERFQLMLESREFSDLRAHPAEER